MRTTLVVMLAGIAALGLSCANTETADELASTQSGLGEEPSLESVGPRYIVAFRDDLRGTSALHAHGGNVVLALPGHHAAAAHLPPQALEALRHHPDIAYVEEDVLRAPLGSGTVETTPYGIGMVQADQIGEGSGDVTVCIIDSGYYASHEDLGGTRVTYSQDIGTGVPTVDGCGHGSHVAGTISARGGNGKGVVGINPSGNFKLHIVKVFGDDCAWAYSSSLVKALDECRTHATGKLVVSMSLGGGARSTTEDNAFANAEAAGVLSVAAAGNDSNTTTQYPAGYASVLSVAAVDSTRTVAAFSNKNSDVELAAPGVAVESSVPWLTNASVTAGGTTLQGLPVEGAALTNGVTGVLVNGGLCDSVGSWSGKLVVCQRGTVSFAIKVSNAQSGGAAGVIIYNNVAGPLSATLGTGVTSPLPAIGLSDTDGATLVSKIGLSGTLVNNVTKPASGYESWDGTSMATPHVSGVAGKVWSNYPTISNTALRAALTSTAMDLGTAGRDTSYGYGLVQAKAAFDALAGTPTCTPTQTVETSCSDGLDNDCDGKIDAADTDCQVSSCTLGGRGAACTVNSDCCSNACKGKPGRKTCK